MRDLRADAADRRAAIRFSPDGGAGYVDVCPLCADDGRRARLDQGGQPDHAERPRGTAAAASRSAICSTPRRVSAETEPVALGADPAPAVRARAGDGRGGRALQREPRTGARSAGSRKSLGEPQASISPLSGVNREVVVTVAWDISWYQYRVSPGLRAAGAARGARAGARASSTRRFPRWNAQLERRRPRRARHRTRLAGCDTGSAAAAFLPYNPKQMIYCVIPRELEGELYDKMVEYYKDNPNVTSSWSGARGPTGARGKSPGREARDSATGAAGAFRASFPRPTRPSRAELPARERPLRRPDRGRAAQRRTDHARARRGGLRGGRARLSRGRLQDGRSGRGRDRGGAAADGQAVRRQRLLPGPGPGRRGRAGRVRGTAARGGGTVRRRAGRAALDGRRLGRQARAARPRGTGRRLVHVRLPAAARSSSRYAAPGARSGAPSPLRTRRGGGGRRR